MTDRPVILVRGDKGKGAEFLIDDPRGDDRPFAVVMAKRIAKGQVVIVDDSKPTKRETA